MKNVVNYLDGQNKEDQISSVLHCILPDAETGTMNMSN